MAHNMARLGCGEWRLARVGRFFVRSGPVQGCGWLEAEVVARKAETVAGGAITQLPPAVDPTAHVWTALGIAVAVIVMALFVGFLARLLNQSRKKE